MGGIDGLRAVAALWVVLFHMRAATGAVLWPGVDLVVRSGSTGVSLFLVLSGLCLYLPYAGGRSDRFRGSEFFRKRVRRLLPTYYVSLAIVLAAYIVSNGRLGFPSLSSSEVAAQSITHVTMTHQLFPETFYGLNGGYWSLGLEWELYLTLPLLIILAVRFGLGRTVAGVFAVTAVYRLGLFAAVQAGLLDPHGMWATVVLPNQFLGRWSEFALGMVAAELFRTRRVRVGWPLALTAVTCALVALSFPDNPLNHMLYGILFFTLVSLVLAGDNPVAKVFSWRPLVAIGVMSYSLYLVHQPLLVVLSHLAGLDPTADPGFAFMILLLLSPVILLAALALFAGVERHSMVPPGAPSVPARHLLFPPLTKPAATAPTDSAPAEAEPAGARRTRLINTWPLMSPTAATEERR
ncbi:MAG: acyltransferase [Propionicimonas sp.]